MLNRIKRYYKKNNGLKGTLQALFDLVKTFGPLNVIRRFFGKHVGYYSDYQYWIQHVEKKYDAETIAKELAALTIQPKISVLLPVYNVDEVYLRACIDSVREQYYQNWELCIADDNSPKPHIRPILESYMEQDERIKVVFREQNGHISEATNSALTIVTGEFVALLDNDDVLKREAFLEVVKVINEHPEADMLYSDEDKINADGTERVGPAFKPGWSPDAFLCHMYLCHLAVYRTEIVKKIGGFRTAYNGSQDYDIALRFSEQTDNIFHVPYILYHWRMIPTSTAMNTGSKNYAYDASVRAKEDAAKRRGYDVEIIPNESEFATNFVFRLNQTDKISIIITVAEQVDSAIQLIQQILNLKTTTHFEILTLGDNDYQSIFMTKYGNEIPYYQITTAQTKNTIIEQHTTGNILAFLADTISIVDNNWLEVLGGQAKVATTGAVSARILNDKGLVQQAGIVMLNQGQNPAFAFHNYSKDDAAYLGRLKLNYNYLAVSEQVLFVSKDKFLAVAGFDDHFVHAYRDIDFCLKLYDQGYYNVCRGDIEFMNAKTEIAGYNLPYQTTSPYEKELLYLQKKWYNKYLQSDPFYNKNFSQKRADFSLAVSKKA